MIKVSFEGGSPSKVCKVKREGQNGATVIKAGHKGVCFEDSHMKDAS